MTDIEKTEGEIKVLQAKLELLKEMESYKSPVEEAYKDIYGVYPPTTPTMCIGTGDIRWRAFQEGYEAAKNDCEEPYCPDEPPEYDEVIARLMEKWKTNPPEFLKFELGKTLEELITEWWCDVFIRNSDLSMEESIDCLVDMIYNWFPKEQSHEGTQNIHTVTAVETHNELLKKIKSKLWRKR